MHIDVYLIITKTIFHDKYPLHPVWYLTLHAGPAPVMDSLLTLPGLWHPTLCWLLVASPHLNQISVPCPYPPRLLPAPGVEGQHALPNITLLEMNCPSREGKKKGKVHLYNLNLSMTWPQVLVCGTCFLFIGRPRCIHVWQVWQAILVSQAL